MSQELLPLVEMAPTASTVCDACTKQLRDCLMDATDAHEAARLVARDTLLLDEARAIAPLVARLAAPCGRDAVYVALQPLIILHGAPKLGDDRLMESWLEIYQKALKELPREALDLAVSDHIAMSSFFPKPAELLKLAEPKAVEIRTLAWRIKTAAEQPVKRAAATKTDKEEAARVVADWRARGMPLLRPLPMEEMRRLRTPEERAAAMRAYNAEGQSPSPPST